MIHTGFAASLSLAHQYSNPFVYFTPFVLDFYKKFTQLNFPDEMNFHKCFFQSKILSRNTMHGFWLYFVFALDDSWVAFKETD